MRPEYAAIQYRRPPFRRGEEETDPTEDVLQKYIAAGAKVFRTDLNGAVTVNAWEDGRLSVAPLISTAIPATAEPEMDGESDTEVTSFRGRVCSIS